jgi:hypothetical protein
MFAHGVQPAFHPALDVREPLGCVSVSRFTNHDLDTLDVRCVSDVIIKSAPEPSAAVVDDEAIVAGE